MSKNRGIKVLGDGSREDALSELKNLKQANKRTNMSPKGYEVVKVHYDEFYCYGVIMQHLDAKRVSTIGYQIKNKFYNSLEKKGITDYDIEDYVREKLRRQGIFHEDCHTGNILAKVKNRKITKLYIVDFTPDMVYFGRPEKW
jgi:hypothetical protein